MPNIKVNPGNLENKSNKVGELSDTTSEIGNNLWKIAKGCNDKEFRSEVMDIAESAQVKAKKISINLDNSCNTLAKKAVDFRNADIASITHGTEIRGKMIDWQESTVVPNLPLNTPELKGPIEFSDTYEFVPGNIIKRDGVEDIPPDWKDPTISPGEYTRPEIPDYDSIDWDNVEIYGDGAVKELWEAGVPITWIDDWDSANIDISEITSFVIIEGIVYLVVQGVLLCIGKESIAIHILASIIFHLLFGKDLKESLDEFFTRTEEGFINLGKYFESDFSITRMRFPSWEGFIRYWEYQMPF